MEKEFKKPSGYKNVNATQFSIDKQFQNSYSCIDYLITRINNMIIQPFCK